MNLYDIGGFGLEPPTSKGPGIVVKTKTGKRGTVYHADGLVGGKYPVYLDNGAKMLCAPEGLTQIGYVD